MRTYFRIMEKSKHGYNAYAESLEAMNYAEFKTYRSKKNARRHFMRVIAPLIEKGYGATVHTTNKPVTGYKRTRGFCGDWWCLSKNNPVWNLEKINAVCQPWK